MFNVAALNHHRLENVNSIDVYTYIVIVGVYEQKHVHPIYGYTYRHYRFVIRCPEFHDIEYSVCIGSICIKAFRV